MTTVSDVICVLCVCARARAGVSVYADLCIVCACARAGVSVYACAGVSVYA